MCIALARMHAQMHCTCKLEHICITLAQASACAHPARAYALADPEEERNYRYVMCTK